ncbi:unnamed protein product [Symbiodinium natans]|uniref:Secreted protein n=2 Tax=Symbiodinium natans TaxID=878477 RepID=A0A812KXN5_9DINO|nr:unnamed protein product [Symbiodinium natans]
MAFLRLACALMLLFYIENACAIRGGDVSNVECKEKLTVTAAKQHFMTEVQKMPATATALCNWATNGQNPDAREEALTYMAKQLSKLQVWIAEDWVLARCLESWVEG